MEMEMEMEMEVDDGEWVLAGGSDDEIFISTSVSAEAEWVMEDGGVEDDATCDERRRSTSGVFYRAAPSGRIAFVPFDPRRSATGLDRSLSSLPPGLAVRAASDGLLCLRGPWSSYYICNPFTGEWTSLPRPVPAHSFTDAAALVFDHTDANYLLICALESHKGTFSFDVFSSVRGNWRYVASDLLAAGRVIANSGVSAGGTAYWRTDHGAILGYSPGHDMIRLIAPPANLRDVARWQLGEAGGRLCCVAVKQHAVEMHVLGPSDRWTVAGVAGIVQLEDGEEWEICGGAIAVVDPPTPLRFQSADLEAILWADGRILGVDVARRTVREARVYGGAAAVVLGPKEDYVAHINTLSRVPSLRQNR